MSNSFFKFKQFTVFQDRCAMKVCTDACLFGAWVAEQFKASQPQQILDIGTGTGLLSLMLAQKLQGDIETVEIDEGAFGQASENIANSIFKGRISTIHADVKQHVFPHTFDLIISNPPFYEGDLRSPETVSNMARHDETLTLEKLFPIVHSNLSVAGSFAVLIPYHRLSYCKAIAGSNKLYPQSIIHVKQTTASGYFRSMIIFTRHQSGPVKENELTIKDMNNYTNEFSALLKSYYPNL